jgi:septal ring factor EnvC (AmiA/AmiB activator)
LPLPVNGPILRGFGQVIDEEFRTKTFYKGVDFGGEAGVPVRAVAAGEVRFAGWFRGYGKIVILDHSEQYFTISGHLESIEVEVGDEVASGEMLGSVGETGSLSGPRLYFEIREGSEALDPVSWFAR